MKTISLDVLPGSFIFAQDKRAPLISAETHRNPEIANSGFSRLNLARRPSAFTRL
jgi:hypothetical protein